MAMAGKLFVALTIILCASAALGQDYRGGRRRNRGGDRASASRSSRRADPTTAAFLRRVDTNGNGMIDEDEVTGEAKVIVEKKLTELGIELKYPIPLSKIISADGGRRRGSRNDDDSETSSSEDKSSSDNASATPSQNGFAAPKPSLPALPGFGQPSERPGGSESKAAHSSKPAAAAASSTPSTPAKSSHTSSGSAAASSDSDPPADAPKRVGPKSGRFLTPQERLSKELPEWFREKDINGDGQVDMAEFASEWTPELVDEFNRYDLNHDGIITQAECLKAMEGSHRKAK